MGHPPVHLGVIRQRTQKLGSPLEGNLAKGRSMPKPGFLVVLLVNMLTAITICFASSGPVQASQNGSGTVTFRITTREVLVDLIALEGRDQLVRDLNPEDLQLSESFISPDSMTPHRPANTPMELETITSLRITDPDALQASGDDTQSGFQINASCLEKSTLHYRLAFRPGPDASRSGYHRVSITTKRPGVKLFYRRHYYVGLTEPPAKPPVEKGEAIDKLLLQSSCSYPEAPLSISLHARYVNTGRADVLRYSVTVGTDSLSFMTLENNLKDAGIDRHVALDYGVCNFDRRGLPLNFFHAPLETVLNSADYARALDRGFPQLLEIPAPENTAMTRVVVRDRETGNLGAVDVAFPNVKHGLAQQTEPAVAQTVSDLKAAESWLDLDWKQHGHLQAPPILFRWVPSGPIGTFGSIVPAPNAFCGDVYQLPGGSGQLPDFRELDPIGSLYTSALDVPNQRYSNHIRIPGEPPGPFGIDYRGVFWITMPGDYSFLLLSDDGGVLRIDDKKVIELNGVHPALAASSPIRLGAGRHSIEVPYFEDAAGAFALELWVRPPGAQSWTLFDLNDYAPPTSASGSSTTPPPMKN